MTLKRLTLSALLLIVLAVSPPAHAAEKSSPSTPSAAPSPAEAVPKTEKSRFEYAMSLYRQAAYDPAAKEFKDLLRDYPRGEYAGEAHYWLGRYYMMNGGYDEGIGQFGIILAEMPSSRMAAQAQYEVAGYLADPANPRHDYEKAIAEYLKIPSFYPGSPLVADAKYYAALCQARLARYDKARDALRSFIVDYPASGLAAPAQYELGLVCLLSGDTDEALASFQAARDDYPAGLYRQKALDSIEIIMRTREKRPIARSNSYGTKGTGPGMFSKPTGLAFTPDGYLIVADSGNGRLLRLKPGRSDFTVESASIVQPGVEKNLRPVKPYGVAVSPDGLLYMTDSSADRVQTIDKEGTPELTIGRHGSGAGEMDAPAGVAVDSGGSIYVCDKGNHRVEKFDSSGRFIKSIGNTGPEDSLLHSPVGVAIGIDGALLVTDDGTDRLYRFDENGKLTALFGEGVPNAYPMKDPAGIAVDFVGNIYVAVRGRSSVVVLDKDLKLLTEYMGAKEGRALDEPVGIAVTGAGVVYVADEGLNQVVVLK